MRTLWFTAAMAGITAACALGMPMKAQAGWQQDTTGWKWQNEDGTYITNGWKYLDGNNDGWAEWYYFQDNGYILTNTTYMGSEFNGDGAYVKDGVVQRIRVIRPADVEQAVKAMDIKLNTDFIKQEYVDLLGSSKAYALKQLGEPDIDSELLGEMTYGTSGGNVTVYYDSTSKIIRAVGGTYGFPLFHMAQGQSSITVEGLNSQLNTQAVSDGNGYHWDLSQNPKVYLVGRKTGENQEGAEFTLRIDLSESAQ